MTTPVQPGDTLAGKFDVERVLGSGGMGVVVVAHHRDLDQRVALKFLLPEALANEEAVQRFRQEAKAASRIKSEHVARILDVGTMPNGAPYIVMEYLDGQDLHDLLKTRGPLPSEDAVDYVLQALEALAEAHAASVVHRDVKPSNLFLVQRADGTPCVKLLDFGIAKVKGNLSDGAATKTTALMGSPWYIAPEQLRSTKSVDGRADLWSLGVVLHELVTGQVVFAADTLPQLCTSILYEEATLQTSSIATIPRGLDAVIRKCLEKDPANRYASARELAAALAPFAPARSAIPLQRIAGLAQAKSAAPPAVVERVTAADDLQSVAASTATAFGGAPRREGRASGALVWALGAAGALALLGVGVFLGSRERAPEPSPAASIPTTARAEPPPAVTAAPPVPPPPPAVSAPPPVAEVAPSASAPAAQPAPSATASHHRTPRAPSRPTAEPLSDFGDRK